MIGIIYKIKCLETNEFYIGSTNDLCRRKRQHKLLRYSSKEIIKRNNYKFIILEKKEFTNNLSLRLLENLYILFAWKTNRCLNERLSYTSDTIKSFKSTIYKKQYYIINKNKSKKYRNDNKEIINQRSRNYYYDNIDKLKKKVNCCYCNAIVTKNALRTHQKRKICLDNRI